MDGSLSVSGRVLQITADLTVGADGWLSAGNNGEIRFGDGSDLQVDGTLQTSGDGLIHVTGGDVHFASSADFSVGFNPIYDDYYGEVIGLEAGLLDIQGTAFLAGTLSLMFGDDFYNFPSGLGDTFTILKAGAISGMFANALEGGRVDLTGYNYSTDQDEVIGTFLVGYTADSLVLSDFQAVPEPGTLALCAIGAVFAVNAMRRRTRRT